MGLATRISVERADRIAAFSHHTKTEIIRHLNVPEEKIVVIPHGIQERYLDRIDTPLIDAVKAKYGIAGEYILSINDIHPRKNIEGLNDAFLYLNETHDIPHQVVLVGQSLWRHESVFQSALSGRYGARIIMTGYVSDEDLAPLYQGASVFVYPSFYEGWGLLVHEAMASGVPVAISNRSSLPEIAGDAALKFDPSDSRGIAEVILTILSDPAMRQDLVRRGYGRFGLGLFMSAPRLSHDHRPPTFDGWFDAANCAQEHVGEWLSSIGGSLSSEETLKVTLTGRCACPAKSNPMLKVLRRPWPCAMSRHLTSEWGTQLHGPQAHPSLGETRGLTTVASAAYARSIS
jgi:hypothetical protein